MKPRYRYNWFLCEWFEELSRECKWSMPSWQENTTILHRGELRITVRGNYKSCDDEESIDDGGL